MEGSGKEYQTVLLTGLAPSWFKQSDITQRDVLPPGVNILDKMCSAKKRAALFKVTSDPKRQGIDGKSTTTIYKESTTFTVTLKSKAHRQKLREAASFHNLKLVNHGNRVFVVTGHLDSIVDFRKTFNERILNIPSTASTSSSASTSNDEEEVDSKNAAPPSHFPDHSYDAYTGLNPDILSILEKSSGIKGLHYSSSEGAVYIKKDSCNKDASISKFQATYQDITSCRGGKKLKMDSLEVSHEFSPVEIEEILGNFNTQYSQTCFSFDQHAYSVKIVSISSRQFESCVKSLKGRFQTPNFLSLTISEGRCLTLKKADIIEESVDVIVNATNGELRGLALAVDRTSSGQVQILSDEVMKHHDRYCISATGNVISTGSDGRLKCKHVLHAVGPTRAFHDPKKVLIDLTHKILREAEKLGAESIAIPAISFCVHGVTKDLVACCIIDSILDFGYSQRTPALNDIRVVVIDQHTHQCFANYLQKERRFLMSPSNLIRGSKFSVEARHQDVDDKNESATNNIETGFVFYHNNVRRSKSDPTGLKSTYIEPTQQPSQSARTHAVAMPAPPSSSSSSELISESQDNTSVTSVGGSQWTLDEYCMTCSAVMIRLTLECGHVVCRQCISEHFKRGNTKCPKCETLIRTKSRTIRPHKPNVCPACSSNFKDPVRSKCGHVVCKKCIKSLRKCSKCCVCLGILKDPVKTPCCCHEFCRNCLDKCMKNNPQCPMCKTALGTPRGNQPPGYQGYGTIVIDYVIPGGVQGPNHPNPGKRYHGTTRRAYLPHNAEGIEIFKLLKRAFDAGLIFTVGTSHTTGQSDVVVWNDIHHKTSPSPGPFGYPDPGYLRRVKRELATKGII